MATEIWPDRFIKRELLPAGELARRYNILNPRIHPESQTDATEASLDKVGWIDEASLSTNGDGPASLDSNPDAVMKDGHDRVKLALLRGGEDALVPVNWYHLSPAETDFTLTVQDAITGMATIDRVRLSALLERSREMLADDRLTAAMDALKARVVNGNGLSNTVQSIPEQFMILIECINETEQTEALEQLTEFGYKCKALIS